MARGSVGEAIYEPQVSAEDLPRKIVPRMEPVPVAQAFGQAVEASNQKYQADSATWAGDQLAQMRVKAINDLETAKNAAPPGDQTGFTEKYLAGFDKDTAKLAQTAGGNEVAGQMLAKGISDLRNTLYTHSQSWVAQQNVAYRKDSVVNNTDAQLASITAHPEIQGQVASTLFDQIRAVGGGNETMLPLMRYVHEKTSLAAADGLIRQNPQGMYDALNDPDNAPAKFKELLSGLSDQQREVVLTKAKGQIAAGFSNSVIDIYRKQGPDIGNKALQAIDSSGQPDDIKTQIYANVEHGVSQWHQESRSALTPQIAALEQRIASGNAGEGDKATAWGLYNKGGLDTNQLVSTIGSITRSQQKGQDDAEKLQFATTAYQQRNPLDPKDARTKDAVDLLFTNMTKGVAPGTPGYNNAVADMVSRVGIVPAAAENWARANLTSGSPQAAASAALMLAHVQATNPRAEMFAEDTKLKAMASSISDAVKAGTDPVAAVTLARSNGALSEADTKALTDQFNTKFAPHQPSALNSVLKGDPNFAPGIFGSLPAVPLTMQTDFNTLTSDYYRHTNGNIAQSRQLALQDLKNTWGVTQVNGKREFMQYAPEAMHPGLTTEALRADIETSTAGMTADPSKVRLIPNAATPYTNGEQWNLGAPDKFGLYNVLTDSRGVPLIYKLPDARVVVQAARDKAASEGMARLHDIQTAARESQQAEWAAIEAERNAPHNRLNY